DQAVLRTRGASRRHLLRMLAVRTTALVGVGALAGLVAGYVAATVVLGHASLARASTSALVSSAVVGTAGGLLVTGAALYLTGRRAIDREIDEDRRRLDRRAPLWRRARLDLVLAFLLAVAVTAALGTGAFEGSAGSVYSGRAVRLDLALLVLPVSVWLAGSLVAARLMGAALARATPTSAPRIDRPGPALLRRSVTRRPWAVVNAALVASLVVALAACLATFTASYDAAKVDDARYSNGADVRVTPSPTAERDYGAGDADRFRVAGVAEVTPVVYSASNVVLRSDRTSDPANLAAVEPTGFPAVAPVDAGTAALVDELERDPTGLILSRDTAGFLQVGVGDRVHVLLARSTPDQVEIVAHVSGLFERLPGFPDGADAVMALDRHLEAVPATVPDFFLASVERGGDAALQEAVTRLRRGPASSDTLSIDTRATTFDRDQSSLAALNVAGLVDLDGAFALAMATVAVGVFVFGLLLQRRREYVVLRAQGVGRGTLRLLIAAEAAIVAVGGAIVGLVVGVTMGALFVAVLRPLFVLDPGLVVPWEALGGPVALLAVATVVASLGAASVVGRLAPTELLRDE
ncbi:MAG: FtsX-like permease family protein, partial [Acidimicrobiales bacterium]|nr:FtsX-like permease family protein [Acidimicrobiales bacterium]